MAEWIDYYCVLQVHSEAEPEIIQGAYKRLCKKYHPDVNADPGASAHIRQVNEAWRVLGDPDARRDFHREWQRRHVPHAQTVVRDRIVYREVVNPDAGIYDARRALHAYLEALSTGRLQDAFARVNGKEQARFGYAQFARWQQAVSQLYEMGSFRLHFFKQSLSPPGEEYTVTLWEKDKRTGVVRQCTFTKIVVRERGQWRVFLGYADLDALAAQLAQEGASGTMAAAQGGPLCRDAFMCRLEDEIVRFRRYGRFFSLSLLMVTPSGLQLSSQTTMAAGQLLQKAVRKADTVAHWEPGCWGILLTETGQTGAQRASRRLARLMRQDLGHCARDIQIGARTYAGGTSAVLIQTCRTQLIRQTG